MATYPIKMLKDENGNLFVPLAHINGVQGSDGTSLQQILNTKLEVSNLIQGNNITLTKSGNNTTIAATVPTTTSQLTNDSGYITKSVNDLTNYEQKADVGHSLVTSLDTTTDTLTVSLKNSAGTVISSDSVSLPLGTMVVSGTYDSVNKKIVLTLDNGNTIDIPVGDLVSGLQAEITSTNKLSSDLVDDTNKTNKFVTAADKTAWNAKYDKPGTGIPSTDLASAVQTSLGKADTAIQTETDPVFVASAAHGISSSDIAAWNAKSDFSGSYSDLTNQPTIPTKTSDLINDAGFVAAYSDATTSASGLMSSADKTKLNSIASGAEVNVQADWNETNTTNDAYIKNKPTIPTVPTNVSFFTNDAGYTTNTGTITSVKMNGITVSSSGEADLGTVITSHQDISGKENSSNKVTSLSSSSTDTQYPSAKCVYDLIQSGGGAIPSGGTTGQVLCKKTNTDYDLEWGSSVGFSVIDSLVSTSTTDALSANQGKVLNEKIPTVYSGSSAPDASTGKVGDIYIMI